MTHLGEEWWPVKEAKNISDFWNFIETLCEQEKDARSRRQYPKSNVGYGQT